MLLSSIMTAKGCQVHVHDILILQWNSFLDDVQTNDRMTGIASTRAHTITRA
jgi:hypothetical protein